jgi:hypothetical protein
LLPGARGALVVGSGGPLFFERFAREAPERGDGAPNALDRYTRRIATEVARGVLGGHDLGHALYFPFMGSTPALPFQRLGRAAGIGPSSPLGVQVHPVYGPWWAYRALIVVDVALSAAVPLGDACAGCPAPCVDACPGRAVRTTGFVIPACHAHRLIAPPCQLSCAARIACVRGPEHRYSDAQLAFHMRASMPRRAPGP